MTWWSKLLGIPEPEDNRIYIAKAGKSLKILQYHLTPELYDDLTQCGWTNSQLIDMTVSNDALIITRSKKEELDKGE